MQSRLTCSQERRSARTRRLCFADQTHKGGPKLRHLLQAASISTQLLCCCNDCAVDSVECIEQRQGSKISSVAFATATKTRIRKCWSHFGSETVEEQLDCIRSLQARGVTRGTGDSPILARKL
eukprot:4287-Heterococcus_DN1.PRE.3